MKKRIFAALLILVLLLCGCDLRNRRPSSDFVPATHETDPRPTYISTEATVSQLDIMEKTFTRHCVHSVSNTHGEYVDIYGKTWTYEFKLPFVDFATGEASACNREIEKRFLTIIKDQQKLEAALEPLTVTSVDFLCYTTGGLVTVNVWAENVDGTTDRSVYCFRNNGTFATPTEIMAALWIDEEEFRTALTERLTKEYIEKNESMLDNSQYTTYLDQTLEQAEDLDSLKLYASEDDRIYVSVKILSPDRSYEDMEFEIRP